MGVCRGVKVNGRRSTIWDGATEDAIALKLHDGVEVGLRRLKCEGAAWGESAWLPREHTPWLCRHVAGAAGMCDVHVCAEIQGGCDAADEAETNGKHGVLLGPGLHTMHPYRAVAVRLQHSRAIDRDRRTVGEAKSAPAHGSGGAILDAVGVHHGSNWRNRWWKWWRAG